MSTPDRDALKGMPQSMEHMLNTLDAASVAATQLIAAQKSGKPLSDRTLAHYTQQFQTLSEQRARFREVIAQWWTMLEETSH